ncbi:MAG: hypothetical protein HY686_08065 [Chloroflexi bacterium]|nr:hypothetical protein [Chloroflexota bacterium]
MLFCFDVDGTLEPGLGPIPVRALRDLVAQGHSVVIVSPSSLRPKGEGFPEFLSRDRQKNLLDAAAAYSQLRPVYVSDNEGDDQLCEQVGFTYVDPRYFAQFLDSLFPDGAGV